MYDQRLVTCIKCNRSHAEPRVWPLVCRCGNRIGGEYVVAKPRPKTGRISQPVRKVAPPDLPCIHRGQSLRKLDCGCEGNSNVYACGIHGECMVRRLKPAAGPDATCNICDDRDEPASYAAIITTHFNPSNRQRLRDTFSQWAEAIGHPFQCYELAFGEPEIPGSVAIRGNADRHAIWQKERLINLAIGRLPESVRYVAWIDHDLIFTSPDWLAIGCEMIRQGCDAVQLFHEVAYQDQSGEIIRRARGSVAAIQTTGEISNSAPGGAWLASRAFVDRIGGIYERNICGGGDATFFQAVAKAGTSYIDRQSPKLRYDCLAYVQRVGAATIGYVPGVVRHLWHGDRANRQYLSRDEILRRHDFDPQRHLRIGQSGLLELSNAPAGLAADIRQYFADRRDDG